MTTSRVLALAVFMALGASCETGTDPDPNAPVTFAVRAFVDTVSQTNGQGGIAYSAVADSIHATLILADLATAPRPELTITQCGAPCFGNSSGFQYGNPGRRNGDSVIVIPYLRFSPPTRMEFFGVLRGDSITGVVRTVYSTSATTMYTGRFVARRTP
jgi:hypothetical protein